MTDLADPILITDGYNFILDFRTLKFVTRIWLVIPIDPKFYLR